MHILKVVSYIFEIKLVVILCGLAVLLPISGLSGLQGNSTQNNSAIRVPNEIQQVRSRGNKSANLFIFMLRKKDCIDDTYFKGILHWSAKHVKSESNEIIVIFPDMRPAQLDHLINNQLEMAHYRNNISFFAKSDFIRQLITEAGSNTLPYLIVLNHNNSIVFENQIGTFPFETTIDSVLENN